MTDHLVDANKMGALSDDDVIRMAREVGLSGLEQCELVEHFRNFAQLAAAHEREACAKICESVDNYANPMTASDCADAIRARGET